MKTTNFDFIKSHWPELFEMASKAEHYAYSDPQSSIIKLRCFTELIVAYLYKGFNLQIDPKSDLYCRLNNQEFKDIINQKILNKFHAIRLKGNIAAHNNKASFEDAVWLIEEAYLVACWFYKGHSNANQNICKKFVIPIDTGDKEDELNNAKIELEKTYSTVEDLQKEINRLKVDNKTVIEEFKNIDKQILNSIDLNDGEIEKRISIEDIFLDYKLTLGQTKLIQKIKTFLSDKNQNIFLLKGYAGTGKTFITKGLIEYFTSIGRNYVLAAPTGKAAKVIQEKTLSKAYTIHKTIYSDKDLKEYQTDEDGKTIKFYFELAVNDNSNDTIYIFDEASMISNVYSEMEFIRFGSGFLLQDLFKYINLDNNDHNKKIIFIGDNAQLPPVGMRFSPALSTKYLQENFRVRLEEFELIDVVRQKEDSGILKNSINIRKTLDAKIFNHLDIDTSSSDIESLEHANFINKYLEVTNNKIDKNTMVIAYTNASVTDYNQAIRANFFDNINQVNVKDKIIILANSSRYDIFLSNGDFGLITQILSDTEHKLVRLKRKNSETDEVENINIDLYFRDIELLVRDIDGTLHKINCKIIENLLFSRQPNLSSDETKAVYLDFMIRNSHLKANTKEWKDAIKSDPYFNALKVKFGYAITCHKAQGSEWKNIFLNCKSHQSYLSEEYFRWLYTALTRASKNLYILDEPHIGITDNISNKSIHMEHINDNFIQNEAIKNNTSTTNPFNIQDKFLLVMYQKIATIVESHNIKILDLQHNQNQEHYIFESNDEQSRVAIYYNDKNIISTINPMETNNLSNLIRIILEPLKNHILAVVEEHNDFVFNEQFLEDFYLALKNKFNNKKIIIANIEHLNYMERYTFCRNDEIAIIDFYYNGKGQFKSPTPNNKSNSRQLIQDILGAI